MYICFQILQSVWMKFSLLPQSVGLLKLLSYLFCTSNILERELCRHDFIKYMINIVLCQGPCELIWFKLGVMLDTTNLYSVIPVWMSLMFTQGHRVTGKLELVQSFCCGIAWSNSIIHDCWLCKEDDFEETLYGKYGSFALLVLNGCLKSTHRQVRSALCKADIWTNFARAEMCEHEHASCFRCLHTPVGVQEVESVVLSPLPH